MHLLEPVDGSSSRWIEPLEPRLMLSAGTIPDFLDIPEIRDAGRGRVLMDVFVSDTTSMVLRLGADGNLDPTFGGGDGVVVLRGVGPIEDRLVQDDGKILLLSLPPDLTVATLYRLNADGTFDDTFGDHGRVWLRGRSPNGGTIALTDDGGILVAEPDLDARGRWRQLDVWRLTSDGQPDAAFGAAGKAVFHSSIELLYTVAVQPRAGGGPGAIDVVIRAPYGDAVVAHLRAAGAPDASAGNSPLDVLHLLPAEEDPESLTYEWSVLPDGRIFLVREDDLDQDLLLFERFTPDGRPDPSFGDHGTASLRRSNWGWITSPPILLPDGRALLALGTSGYTTAPFSGIDLLMIGPDGALDPAFADNGVRVLENRPGIAAVGFSASVDSKGDLLTAYPTAVNANNVYRASELIVDQLRPDGASSTGLGDTGRSIIHIDPDLVPQPDYVELGPPPAPPADSADDGQTTAPPPSAAEDPETPPVAAAAPPLPFSTLEFKAGDDATGELAPLLLGVLPARSILGQADDDLFAA